jgi:hypothetical protein
MMLVAMVAELINRQQQEAIGVHVMPINREKVYFLSKRVYYE